jgi:predicted dithiol-disulfide oxidoreductase (DUF899 family)
MGPVYNFTKEPFAAEMPGFSAFALEDSVVYHTYSCYTRGLDALNGANQLLDRAPSGGVVLWPTRIRPPSAPMGVHAALPARVGGVRDPLRV